VAAQCARRKWRRTRALPGAEADSRWILILGPAKQKTDWFFPFDSNSQYKHIQTT
jgi:hypothetical protein